MESCSGRKVSCGDVDCCVDHLDSDKPGALGVTLAVCCPEVVGCNNRFFIPSVAIPAGVVVGMLAESADSCLTGSFRDDTVTGPEAVLDAGYRSPYPADGVGYDDPNPGGDVGFDGP